MTRLEVAIDSLEEEPGFYVLYGTLMSLRYVGIAGNVKEHLTSQLESLKESKHPNQLLQKQYDELDGRLDLFVRYATDIEEAAQLDYSLRNYPVGPQKLMNTPEVFDDSIWNL